MVVKSDNPVILMETPLAWEQWLEENHQTHGGLWLQIAKKGSQYRSVSYDQALDIALCFGWIDGQKKSLDNDYFLQRFTSRRSGSLWSKRNVGKVLTLMEAGRLRPAGLAEVRAAQEDGRWAAAYDGPKDMVLPDDFLIALADHPSAAQFYTSLGKMAKYAIGLRLQTAKTPETRQRRMENLLQLLDQGKTPTL